MNAAAIVKAHPNLFLLCVSNFSCTIDAFTQSMLASVMGSKPHLILEIDAHTAGAGIQTRLEAFLDIAANYPGAPSQRRATVQRLPVASGRPRCPQPMASPSDSTIHASKFISRTFPNTTPKPWPWPHAGWG